MVTAAQAIDQTKQWIQTVVIGFNFCPFAARVYNNKTIGYTVSAATSPEESLTLLKQEVALLDSDDNIETAVIIFTEGFKAFEAYLQLVKKADRLLAKEGYEGIYQVASFHPMYCFQGSAQDDPANYTNRSVYPMLHLLKEESIDKALKFFPHPEKIPENNMAFAREKGLRYMQLMLQACR